ncbi:MAG TPA: AAA family ATPase [Acidobacteriaceae bacterium]
MYKAFFNLTRNPFELTPNPTCFVPTKRHSEALTALYYGIRQHKGFVVLTGEVGTGKTLLLRCLLALLKESKDIAYAYLFNGRLSPTEFLQYIVSDFRLPVTGKNKSDLLFDLGQFLGSRGSQKMTTVLIVDEAHHLSEDILEELRLLSNLETDDDKLLQIVLVGQPELDEKLDSVGLRQLKQRIAVRTQLGSLDAEETKRYIEQRLQIAGADLSADPLFSAQTITAVHRHSKGLPRLINTICDNALMTAYARGLQSVTPEVIGDVAKEFRLDMVGPPDAARSKLSSEMDVQRITNLLLDLYAAMRRPIASDTDLGASAAIEVSKHEPYI